MNRIMELELFLAIRKAIENKELNTNSAMSLVAKGMEFMEGYKTLAGDEKKKLLIKVLETIAAGSDGIIGTDDDILPPSTIEALKTLLTTDLIGDVIGLVLDASQGKFQFNKAVEVAKKSSVVLSSCFPCLKNSKLFPMAEVAVQEPVENPLAVAVTIPPVHLPVEKQEKQEAASA